MVSSHSELQDVSNPTELGSKSYFVYELLRFSGDVRS